MDWKSFSERACKAGHPSLKLAGVPVELQYRIAWCRKWLLESREASVRALRPIHVAEAAQDKRILLTKEILEDINHCDVGCFESLGAGCYTGW